MTIYDRIFELEGKLDKEGLSFLDRRLTLRRAFDEVRAEALREGHQEGLHDGLDSSRANEKAARYAGLEAGGGD